MRARSWAGGPRAVGTHAVVLSLVALVFLAVPGSAGHTTEVSTASKLFGIPRSSKSRARTVPIMLLLLAPTALYALLLSTYTKDDTAVPSIQVGNCGSACSLSIDPNNSQLHREGDVCDCTSM